MAEIMPFPMGKSIPSSCLTTCSYCSRALTQRVFAAHRSYCNALCAAFWLLGTFNDEYGVEDEMTGEALVAGVERLLSGETPILARVRDSDIDQALAELPLDRLIVPISDDGVPDWRPAAGAGRETERGS
jgi:hypothetical protein